MFKKVKNKNLKYVLNLTIMFLVIFLVLYLTLKDEFNQVVENISKMNYGYLLLAIIFMILYRFFLGVSLYIITKCNKQKYSLKKSFILNFITQFFNGITPFASGGQPFQIYYLYKEDIPYAKATNIVLQNFILFQTALIIFGVFAVVFNRITGLFPRDNFVANLVTLGFAINFLVWLGSFVISFGKRLNNFILNKAITFLAKIKIVKNKEKIQEKFQNYITSFYENALVLKNQKKQVFFGILANLVALFFQYAVPFILIKGLGIADNITFASSIVAVSYTMIIGSFVPIPGGTGGLEYGFMFFFGQLISDNSILVTVMLLWRVVTYYLGMIFGGILIPLTKKESD